MRQSPQFSHLFQIYFWRLESCGEPDPWSICASGSSFPNQAAAERFCAGQNWVQGAQSLVWQSEWCPLPHNPWKALRDVSSPKWTREVCLEGNREGYLQALLHLLLISSEISFFRLLKITNSSSKLTYKGGFKAKQMWQVVIEGCSRYHPFLFMLVQTGWFHRGRVEAVSLVAGWLLISQFQNYFYLRQAFFKTVLKNNCIEL